MQYYASNCSNGKTIDLLREVGIGVLLNPAAHNWDPYGLKHVIDSGAWHAHTHGVPLDEDSYERLLDLRGATADFVVLPDIVGKRESLAYSVRWLNRVRGACDLVLIPVQNGMTIEDLAPYVGPSVGIFLGGDTPWKLSTMGYWGEFCAEREIHYHVARVNTITRFTCANGSGANSADGSSAVKFRKTIPLLVNGIRQPDIFCPRRLRRLEAAE